MIVNLPTSEALNTTALKLYFRAWRGIVTVLYDFDASFSQACSWGDLSQDEYSEERADYLDGAQEDLHAMLAIIQQTNEIALKARIVEVSPYLLLLNNDMPFGAGNKPIEFATLRTLDAVDLPKAVNTLTEKPVGSDYIQRYGELRIQRNQYAHLGDTSLMLDPVEMCAVMIDQYRELWPGRAWFRDRVEYTHVREAFFDDKHWSSRQEIMYLLEYDKVLIPADRFKKLFSVAKSAVRFGCYQCQDDWAVGRNGPSAGEAPTAFYTKEKKAMHCLLCDADFAAILAECDECDGKFRVAESEKFGAGRCFDCGHEH